MNETGPDGRRADENPVALPVWSKPTFTMLDVERGTLGVSGPHFDGIVASTS